MRKILAITLALLLLCGCSANQEGIRFYYRQRELSYGSDQPVIAMEYREAPGHEDELEYLLNMYLEGPLDATLTAPFPEGTTLEDIGLSADTLTITLSDAYAELDDMDHSIASACIACTCFDLTDAQTVIIDCHSPKHGNKSITLSRDMLVLSDDSIAPDQ